MHFQKRARPRYAAVLWLCVREHAIGVEAIAQREVPLREQLVRLSKHNVLLKGWPGEHRADPTRVPISEAILVHQPLEYIW